VGDRRVVGGDRERHRRQRGVELAIVGAVGEAVRADVAPRGGVAEGAVAAVAESAVLSIPLWVKDFQRCLSDTSAWRSNRWRCGGENSRS
jgi:hypothetical protein